MKLKYTNVASLILSGAALGTAIYTLHRVNKTDGHINDILSLIEKMLIKDSSDMDLDVEDLDKEESLDDYIKAEEEKITEDAEKAEASQPVKCTGGLEDIEDEFAPEVKEEPKTSFNDYIASHK